ncbi:MAG: nucleotidyltransferase family protein [Alphaproteobacteria bacterium]|nr:nucleotidyltransferase family protein [Alphaproteobacteria bacterium]
MISFKAFILAAGFGTRMLPLTNRIPKPLVEIAGRSLIDRILDHLEQANIQDVMINTHHLSDVLTKHLEARIAPKITFSHEEKILDTGGGIKRKLSFFNNDPFFVISGDSFWENGRQNTLKHLSSYWDSDKMDVLLLLQPVSSMNLTNGIGDYNMDKDGRITRSKDKTGKYMFTSIRINHPRAFKNTRKDIFSYLEIMDNAEHNGRLYGLVHEGKWYHISTLKDLNVVNNSVNNAHEQKDIK